MSEGKEAESTSKSIQTKRSASKSNPFDPTPLHCILADVDTAKIIMNKITIWKLCNNHHVEVYLNS